MLLLFLAIYLKTSSGLLVSIENRIATRNITCQHGLPSTKIKLLFNCEACLITSRYYDIETTLSLAGAGPKGVSYACLQVNDVEIYHENLIRECLHYPKETMNGYDDFCIASPYNIVRGSYRACICITNACNFDYLQCTRQKIPNGDLKSPTFTNTITELTNRIKYHLCKNYVFDHGVLCAISVDRTDQIARQTLVPSIYSAYIIKYKTQYCDKFTTTSKSIYFSQCQLEDTVCMCTVNECDKDLETCRTSDGIYKNFYSISILLITVVFVYI